jgi:hypothetical protein
MHERGVIVSALVTALVLLSGVAAAGPSTGLGGGM